jgi:hypothetical protein
VVLPPCLLNIHSRYWLRHDLGGDASVAVLENENMRLREREQALMDAVGLRRVFVCLCAILPVRVCVFTLNRCLCLVCMFYVAGEQEGAY